MDKAASNEVKTVGIVGGGKRGYQLFQLFSNSKLTKVGFVVDVNPSAPGIVAARQAKVSTYSNIDAAIARRVDFIIEVTGDSNVVETVTQMATTTHTRVITHDMAYLILAVISENNQRIAKEITEIKGEITKSLQGISQLVESIEDITSQMNMLSINARIEAAHVGDQGKGFAIVASEIGKSAEDVKEITRQIEAVNSAIADTSARIDASLNRLD